MAKNEEKHHTKSLIKKELNELNTPIIAVLTYSCLFLLTMTLTTRSKATKEKADNLEILTQLSVSSGDENMASSTDETVEVEVTKVSPSPVTAKKNEKKVIQSVKENMVSKSSSAYESRLSKALFQVSELRTVKRDLRKELDLQKKKVTELEKEKNKNKKWQDLYTKIKVEYDVLKKGLEVRTGGRLNIMMLLLGFIEAVWWMSFVKREIFLDGETRCLELKNVQWKISKILVMKGTASQPLCQRKQGPLKSHHLMMKSR